MKKAKSLDHGHRFPAAVISGAIRWHRRFNLSLRDIEELPFERGVTVSDETIRCWCDEFGADFAPRVKAANLTTPIGPTGTLCLSRPSVCPSVNLPAELFVLEIALRNRPFYA